MWARLLYLMVAYSGTSWAAYLPSALPTTSRGRGSYPPQYRGVAHYSRSILLSGCVADRGRGHGWARLLYLMVAYSGTSWAAYLPSALPTTSRGRGSYQLQYRGAAYCSRSIVAIVATARRKGAMSAVAAQALAVARRRKEALPAMLAGTRAAVRCSSVAVAAQALAAVQRQ